MEFVQCIHIPFRGPSLFMGRVVKTYGYIARQIYNKYI